MVLDPHVVRITTATVEIRVLKVSNKQLTQAVFKQLPYKYLVTEGDYCTGRDKSNPYRSYEEPQNYIHANVWGWVKYCPGCQWSTKWDRADHIHVIWEYNGILYQCPVTHYPQCNYRDEESGCYKNYRDIVDPYFSPESQLFIAV